ncbi:hypothetical protein RRG08_008139 [Elysia crispata]|uniref:Uncharacterized protein n=1 Tax=Elysia crispata TaxID=231223 RepID=A0AAE0Z521_9GAST|nr:hypothetical protein RRG08_008139 [Elysia crispata]
MSRFRLRIIMREVCRASRLLHSTLFDPAPFPTFHTREEEQLPTVFSKPRLEFLHVETRGRMITTFSSPSQSRQPKHVYLFSSACLYRLYKCSHSHSSPTSTVRKVLDAVAWHRNDIITNQHHHVLRPPPSTTVKTKPSLVQSGPRDEWRHGYCQVLAPHVAWGQRLGCVYRVITYEYSLLSLTVSATDLAVKCDSVWPALALASRCLTVSETDLAVKCDSVWPALALASL